MGDGTAGWPPRNRIGGGDKPLRWERRGGQCGRFVMPATSFGAPVTSFARFGRGEYEYDNRGRRPGTWLHDGYRGPASCHRIGGGRLHVAERQELRGSRRHRGDDPGAGAFAGDGEVRTRGVRRQP